MRELLFSVTIKDCEVQSMCAGGKGGQHQNKTESAIRITHKPSGAVGVARDSKSQHANKKAAFERMARSKEFQRWLRIEASRVATGKTIEQRVDEQMEPRNLKCEALEGKEWVKFDCGEGE